MIDTSCNRMLSKRNGVSVQSPLIPFSVFVFHLFLTHSCQGQSQLIGSPQPVVAKVGDDIILPCHIEPAVDVAAMTLEWTRSDLDPVFVHVWRAGQNLPHTKHPSYKGRTSLFTDELKHGNISLKLFQVKAADAGTYRCYIPKLNEGSLIELVIGTVASPIIDLAGMERDRGGVVLQCESKGWYPEPEVLWLDGEGNVLSAGPTETVRGPDDLYTVSSRVTVEKRHGHRFTCRVQQNNINQTRETQIHVPDDFFNIQSSISPAIVGLAVSLAVCILSILSLALILWKKQNIIKSKRQWDETNKGKRKNCSNTRKTEHQVYTKKETEREQLVTNKTVEMKECDGENKCVENKDTELQKLREEKQEKENNLQTLKNQLEDKNKEMETVKANIDQWWIWSLSKEACQWKKMDVEKEVETLKKQLETETDQEIKDKKAEVQQLQDEIQRIETNVLLLMENKESNSTEVKRQTVFQQRFEEEKQRREEAESKVHNLKEALETEKEKVDQLLADNKKLNEEKQRSEAEQQQLQRELETKKQETSGSDGQDLPTNSRVIVDEIDPNGRYIRLKNTFSENLTLGNWKLDLEINKKSNIYKFSPGFILNAEAMVTIWASDAGHKPKPPGDVVWKNQKSWSTKETLKAKLKSPMGETMHVKTVDYP